MSYSHPISRRVFLQGLAAGSAGLLTSVLPLSAASKKVVVGFLYVGPRPLLSTSTVAAASANWIGL